MTWTIYILLVHEHNMLIVHLLFLFFCCPQPYFYNVDGDFSLWQLPTGSMANIQVQVQCEDEDGNLFWLNESTGEIEPMQLLND